MRNRPPLELKPPLSHVGLVAVSGGGVYVDLGGANGSVALSGFVAGSNSASGASTIALPHMALAPMCRSKLSSLPSLFWQAVGAASFCPLAV